MTNQFTSPMTPWPELQSYAHQAQILKRSLFYYDTGPDEAKPPCLLVHGLGDEADTWRGVFPLLAARRRVIALDLPGFGRSELPDPPFSILVYVNTLLALLDQLDIPRVTLVGHSLGAVLVHEFALQHPAWADGLVLVSGGLAMGKSRLTLSLLLFLIPGIGEWAYNHLRRDPQAAYQTLYPYYAHLDALPQAERDFLFKRVNQRVWSDMQRRAFLGTMRSLVSWLPAQQKTLAQRLAASSVPTRVVWGAEDQIASPENAHLLASLYPADFPVQVNVLLQAGHNVQQETPGEVAQNIQ